MTSKEWDWEARSPGFWDEYLKEDETHVRALDEVHWSYDKRKLTVGNIRGGKKLTPIHPNIRLLLETVKQLKPESVADFGCGFGDMLYNIKLLLPYVSLYGYDISEHRLKCVCEHLPILAYKAFLKQADFGLPGKFFKVDLAYTSIVIMHILEERRLVALRNVFETATKHVILMENWGSHSFMDDIEGLHRDKPFSGWNKLHFYYRYSVEYNRPHLMVVSKNGDLPYKRIDDYDIIMRQPLMKAKKEGRP